MTAPRLRSGYDAPELDIGRTPCARSAGYSRARRSACAARRLRMILMDYGGPIPTWEEIGGIQSDQRRPETRWAAPYLDLLDEAERLRRAGLDHIPSPHCTHADHDAVRALSDQPHRARTS